MLALQYRGLAKVLALTDEQRDRIDATFAEFEDKTRTVIAEFRKMPDRREEELKRLRLGRRDAVEAILTPEQMTKFRSLKGEPSPSGRSES